MNPEKFQRNMSLIIGVLLTISGLSMLIFGLTTDMSNSLAWTILSIVILAIGLISVFSKLKAQKPK